MMSYMYCTYEPDEGKAVLLAPRPGFWEQAALCDERDDQNGRD